MNFHGLESRFYWWLFSWYCVLRIGFVFARARLLDCLGLHDHIWIMEGFIHVCSICGKRRKYRGIDLTQPPTRGKEDS